MDSTAIIRVGIGGWTFAPWCGSFYPEKLPHSRELDYASRRLTAIEINGTYYATQKPATFAKWAKEVPDGFKFTVKGNRFVTNRKLLATAGESMMRFLGSGLAELGDRLGPILWQFAPTKKFEPDDFGAFLALLPASQDGVPLRHAMEVRHASFATPEFTALARRHAVAVVYAEHHSYPEIADVTADFVYARLQKGSDDVATCYPPEDLDRWAGRVARWAAGGTPDDLPLIDRGNPAPARPRDVYVFFIHEGKSRAPRGAMALIERLKQSGAPAAEPAGAAN